MDQEGHITGQKGQKMYEKAKDGVFGPEIPAAEFYLAPSPLNGKSFCPKIVSGNGG